LRTSSAVRYVLPPNLVEANLTLRVTYATAADTCLPLLSSRRDKCCARRVTREHG